MEKVIFETFIQTRGDIYTFSDVHGDIDALIINLRDNAKVIQKKPGFNFDQNTRDIDLVGLLNLNLNVNENDYKNDLNYE
jgi:hypothetical protein